MRNVGILRVGEAMILRKLTEFLKQTDMMIIKDSLLQEKREKYEEMKVSEKKPIQGGILKAPERRWKMEGMGVSTQRGSKIVSEMASLKVGLVTER